MPPVPLVVPLREADPPEQVNPVQLSRPVGAPPSDRKSDHTAPAGQDAPHQRRPPLHTRHPRTLGPGTAHNAGTSTAPHDQLTPLNEASTGHLRPIRIAVVSWLSQRSMRRR